MYLLYPIIRAMANAAPAAAPPISIVWNPELHALIPVRRPLIKPNKKSAINVKTTET